MITHREFADKMNSVWDELSQLYRDVERITKQMENLKNQGMADATIHIRSDNGGMELLHPTGSEYEQRTGRRREYIGKKPDAQEQARQRVGRWASYRTLELQEQKASNKISQIHYQIERLEIISLGRQAKLFSVMGANQHAADFQFVPKDWKWLIPQMVIDYFKQSPVLAGIAGDVEEVLGKIAWTEQKAA